MAEYLPLQAPGRSLTRSAAIEYRVAGAAARGREDGQKLMKGQAETFARRASDLTPVRCAALPTHPRD